MALPRIPYFERTMHWLEDYALYFTPLPNQLFHTVMT